MSAYILRASQGISGARRRIHWLTTGPRPMLYRCSLLGTADVVASQAVKVHAMRTHRIVGQAT